MTNLTFGEQVKIILGRKGMTIKELAELVERYTGKPMSRQNMTQRLGRDNFQEQDMRMIADILGCQFTLNIMEPSAEAQQTEAQQTEAQQTETQQTEAQEIPQELQEENTLTRDITIEELVDTNEEMSLKTAVAEAKERDMLRRGIKGYFKKSSSEEQKTASEAVGEINPYTQKEYESNSVRIHPKRIGYVQVYDQELHKWTDMTEWAFLGYQERKKKLLGEDYKPPIYLD